MSAWASQLAGSKKAQKSRRLQQLTRDQKPAAKDPAPVRSATTGRPKRKKTAKKATEGN